MSIDCRLGHAFGEILFVEDERVLESFTGSNFEFERAGRECDRDRRCVRPDGKFDRSAGWRDQA